VTFGRQNNLSRRSHRADESFHRSKRRKGVERVAMLDIVKSGPRPPSAARRFLSALTGLFRRR
jgi:hypothetical protein